MCRMELGHLDALSTRRTSRITIPGPPLAKQPAVDLLKERRLRGGECLSVLADNAYFFSVQARELYSFSEECVFVILVVCGKTILMNKDHILAPTAGASEIWQQLLNLRRQSLLFSATASSRVSAISIPFRLSASL